MGINIVNTLYEGTGVSSENRQKIGPMLQMARRKSGISQGEVTEKTGIAQSTLSRLESGDSNFRIGTLESYMDARGKKLNLISKDADLFHYTAQGRPF